MIGVTKNITVSCGDIKPRPNAYMTSFSVCSVSGASIGTDGVRGQRGRDQCIKRRPRCFGVFQFIA